MRCTIIFIIVFLKGFTAYSQADSLAAGALNEVVFTGTRSEKMLSALPMPVTVVSGKQIRTMGSMRLGEVLQEQTGLVLTNNHGVGVQMQGFDPAYTLILIDGEPIIGRTAGTLELSRIAVGNIKQIEIVKGASSSLYGSEALAGVINIITDTKQQTELYLTSRYGTNQTFDNSLTASLKYKRLLVNVFANRFSTEGYDFSPNTHGQTVAPFGNYTLQPKLRWQLGKQLTLKISSRFFTENQQSGYNIGSAQEPVLVNGTGKVRDFLINPTLDWRVSQQFKWQFRIYGSRYKTSTNDRYATDGRLYDATFFDQQFWRFETQTDYFPDNRQTLIAGAGHVIENVWATRYTQKQTFGNSYVFVQHDWRPNEKLNLVTGLRADHHSVYGSRVSPKLSLQYQLRPQLALRASVGSGFKAPDFRQLYLNFNNAVAGYSVFGSEEAAAAIAQLQAQNQIAELLLPTDQIGTLKAETSVNYNIGAKGTIAERFSWQLNLFRNDVSNLIETQVIARKTNGQNVFSYRNLSRIYTQGLETDVSYRLGAQVTLSAGYQYLLAHDKGVLDQIEAGLIFKRDPQTLFTSRITRKDYGGLMGRSKHTANLKLFVQDAAQHWSGSLRVVYRSRFGFGDNNGNLVLDNDTEYAGGFATLHLSVAKEICRQKLRLQAGCDNLLNYTDKTYQPNIAGRLVWCSAAFYVGKAQ